jgi:hypothetical protein
MQTILKRNIMMKNVFILLAVISLSVSCNNNDNAKKDSTDSLKLEKKEITEIKLTEFESKAGGFIGKEVKITGVVDHVCKHGGKKFLLVDGDKSLHVFNDNKFEETLSGSKVTVTGIVEEEKIDSAYIAETVNHEIGSHGSGTKEDKMKIKGIKEWAKMMTDSLKKEGVDHFSDYSLKFVSLEENK